MFSPLKPISPSPPIIVLRSGILTPEILPSASVVVEPLIKASRAGMPVVAVTKVPSAVSVIFKGVYGPESVYCPVTDPCKGFKTTC